MESDQSGFVFPDASLLRKNKAAIQNFTARITDLDGCSVPQPDINSTLAKYAQKIAIIESEGDKDVQFIRIYVENVDQYLSGQNWSEIR